jgi:CAAX prenyl protease-like protein
VTGSPATPYVLPFGVFVALIAVGNVLPFSPLAIEMLRMAVMLAVIFGVARPVLDWRVRQWGGSLLAGLLIFIIWIAPDLLFPAYRHSFLLDNAIAGTARSSLPESVRHDGPVLFLRTLRAVLIVPIVEELFWRGWLMRWVIAKDFESVPLGTYTAKSFWIVAVLFASEHGPYWDVGLAAGILFNWWMIRTKRLGDLMVAHAVANAALSAYVIAAGKWEYWL